MQNAVGKTANAPAVLAVKPVSVVWKSARFKRLPGENK
jgi:hypothetical protein